MGQSMLLNNHRMLEGAAKFYIPTSSLYTVNQVPESLKKWFGFVFHCYISLVCKDRISKMWWDQH